jgi:hypothetical protein
MSCRRPPWYSPCAASLTRTCWDGAGQDDRVQAELRGRGKAGGRWFVLARGRGGGGRPPSWRFFWLGRENFSKFSHIYILINVSMQSFRSLL